MNRIAVAFVTVGFVSAAHAGVEVGGTAGAHVFSETNAVGVPEGLSTHQANSAFFGFRLGVYFTKMLGVELEGGLIPTESAGAIATFDIYNVVGRGHLIAQFRNENPDNKIIPFALVGGGLLSVVDISTPDDSQFKKESGPFGYVGVGAKYRATGGWGVRLDGRLIGEKSTDDSITTDFELLFSLYKDFSAKSAPIKKEEPTKTAASDTDPDQDGIAGDADKCPKEAEDKDGFQDDDGCPDLDNDSDGIADAGDKCPAEPEDKDNFQDDDGCPDPDNDADGVADATDKCADQPETKNGFEDDDGCPDELPAKLAAYTGTIAGINFKVNSADLLPASNKTLDKAVAVLAEFKDVKVEIQGHTDDQPLKAGGKFSDNDALSQARAEAVKAYFIKKGVTEDRLVAKGFGGTVPVQDPAGLTGAKLNAARTVNRRVEFKLISPGGEEAKPEPKKEEPKAEEPKPEEKKEEPKVEKAKAEKKAEEKKAE
ncbi:MAG TPA: OmpA family protein [Kofleriaceae bacterium]|nr:OmpA family protein [Kofleriaceae bacterium]